MDALNSRYFEYVQDFRLKRTFRVITEVLVHPYSSESQMEISILCFSESTLLNFARVNCVYIYRHRKLAELLLNNYI